MIRSLRGLEQLTAPDGTRLGDPVPDSEWKRSFCVRCRTPMRVTVDRVHSENYCSDCDPPHRGVGGFDDPVAKDDIDAFKIADDQ